MDITEVTTKSALVRSRIPGVEFVINPYTGCGHGCRYCYAVFMGKYSKQHQQTAWGAYVEVKTNIVEVLRSELAGKRRTGTAMLSSVCDPYQPAEARYRLTRGCIEALREHGWGVSILTRSPLVTRDSDLLRTCIGASVGFSIPTDDDTVRQVLEPHAPSIPDRIEALRQVHATGIHTWVFVAPMLPMNPVRLAEMIRPHIDEIMVDGLNYKGQVAPLFRQHGWDEALTGDYAKRTGDHLALLLR
ncbi:MAG: radical SAM protein [Kiritimatiellae bacterium]|nr:radical SAM protein [Kiritimatiellia bacterium]